jgi:Flp pilus assembly protein CpaB
MIFLAAAIVFAAFIVRGNSNAVTANATQTQIVAEFDTVQVPVPAHYVEAGTRIGDVRFTNVAFPRHQIPEGALLDTSGLEQAKVMVALPARLPLFPENLSLTGARGNAVIDRIPEGMRAITIRVDATTVVEGWAGSGAIVDVLLVEDDRTTVVAELVKILSAERSVQPVAGEATPAVPSTVTLLVSQEQALAINTALPRGRITFALRSFRDESHWGDRIYTSDRFRKGSATTDPPIVSGYISFSGKGAYALADGKWIPTEVRPSGFLVATDVESAEESEQ